MNLTLRKHLPFLLATVVTLFLMSFTLVFANSTGEADESSQFSKGIQEVLWSIVNNVFGWLTGIGGMIMDYAIREFVVGFGDQFLNRGVGAAVDDLWVAVRDIFNLTFIFGLVWIGFKMILNSDDSNTRRWLIYLIMAALLVNFSLFITKFIVDFSNILATEIVNSGFGTPNVSEVFVQIVGLPTVWDDASGNNKVFTGEASGYGYIFGAMFIFLIAAFVFAAGGIMLIIRFIALSLYMVMSPLMFLGWVFPQLQGITSQYWRGFLGRAFYAPVYILLIFFAATIVNNLQVSMIGGNANFGAVLGGTGAGVTGNFERTFIPFILSCGFLIAAIVVAGKMSADGASTVIRVGNNIRGRVQRGAQRAAVRTAKTAAAPATAGAGLAARRTSYALGSGLEKQIERMQNANKETRTGRAMRAVGGMTSVDRAGRDTAKNLKSKKFGLSTTRDEDLKRRSEIDKRVSNNDTVKAGMEAERLKGTENIINPATGEVVRRSALSEAELKKAEEAQENMIAEMQSTVNNYSVKQLEEMMQSQPQQFDAIIGKLKTGQFDKLMDSDNLNPKKKDEIYGKRVNAIKENLGQSINEAGEAVGEIYTDKLKDLSVKQIETLGDEFIRENAAAFSQSQMDDIKKSDSFTEAQKGSYIGARKTKQLEMASDPQKVDRLFNTTTAGDAPNSVKLKAKKPVEIANLPFETYINNGAVNTSTIGKLDASALEEIFNKKTLNADQRSQLREQIMTHGNDSAKNYLRTPLGSRNWGAAEGDQAGGNQGGGLLGPDGRPLNR